jgi:C4-dicarboxylate-specific signal transduction histidine kinase
MADKAGHLGGQCACQRQVVSEIFHALSQPLTALHCLLELALRAEPNIEQQQQALQEAMKLAAGLMGRVKHLRQMAEADDPGHPTTVPLAWALKSLVEELGPVAEADGSHIEYEVGTLIAYIDPSRLREALFQLIDSMLPSAAGRELHIKGEARNGYAEVSIFSAAPREQTECTRRDVATPPGVLLAERIIKAARGRLTAQRDGIAHRYVIELPQKENQ